MNVYTRPSFERALSSLDSKTQNLVLASARKIPESFGRPHQHSGLGIRRLGDYFEFRVGLKLRVIFIIESGDAVLVTLGNHDDVVRFLHENR